MKTEKQRPKLIVSRPANHMEVEGELCKLFYQRFGDKALPIIEAVFHEWGITIGERLKTKMPARGLKAAIETYMTPVMNREPKPEVIECSDKKFEAKIFTCPYQLNGAGRPLCEAMTAMDSAILEVLIEEEVENWVLKTLADPGGECCYGIITPKTP